MATLVQKQPVRSLASNRPKRTRAMPKHSLFGTSLEIQSQQQRAQLQKIDVNTFTLPDVKKRNEKPLPEYMKAQLPSRDIIDRKRSEVEQQKIALQRAKQDLRETEDQALSFRCSPQGAGSRMGGSRSHQWLTKKDLEHAQEINVGGLNNRGSYNRDKYGRSIPVHNYSLIGDVLRPGMAFTGCEKQECTKTSAGTRSASRSLGERQSQNAGVGHAYPQSIVDLPPNIRHQFGSRVCDSLLADEKKVTQTLEKQKSLTLSPKHHRRTDVGDLDLGGKGQYEMLGNAIRQNVFPGYTMNHKQSITKSVYNDEVHLHRIPDTDEYRYKRDELSTWAEHNVLRQRMKKAWDQNAQQAQKKD